jgi:peptidyl-dipeptidase A
MVLLIFTRFFG